MQTGAAGLAGKEGNEAPFTGKSAGICEGIGRDATAETGKDSLLSEEDRLGTLLSEPEDLLSSAFFERKKPFLALFPFSLAQKSS